MTKDKVEVLTLALGSPLKVGVYKDSKLIKSYIKDEKTSDILPTVFKEILDEFDLSAIYMANGPGSFMAIKVSFVFLKTISITKKIPLFGCDGFFFNQNSPIKAVGNRFFMKKNGTILAKIFDGNKEDIKPFELPPFLDKTIFKEDVEPLYVLPAV